MRRRPRTNRRRGLIRAALAVLALAALLIAIIAVVASLTAPKVNAPVPPVSPGASQLTPIATPLTTGTALPLPTVALPTVAPRATARPTKGARR